MSVDLSISGDVATILLNRPDKLNALTLEMRDQLAEHLDRCRQDNQVRAVVLAGAGRIFCAGADIGGLGAKQDGKQGVEAMVEYNDVVRRLHHLPKPVIAAVHGAVVGIAWTFTLCCDRVLVAQNTKFNPGFLNLDKVPEGCLLDLMSQRIGQLKAREIVYAGRIISGQEVVDLGLATHLVGEESLMAEAMTQAREAAVGSPRSSRS